MVRPLAPQVNHVSIRPLSSSWYEVRHHKNGGSVEIWTGSDSVARTMGQAYASRNKVPVLSETPGQQTSHYRL